jgi:rubrerythrin
VEQRVRYSITFLYDLPGKSLQAACPAGRPRSLVRGASSEGGEIPQPIVPKYFDPFAPTADPPPWALWRKGPHKQYRLGAKLIKGPRKDAVAGEQCTITTYKNLMDATKDKDMVTYNMALTILEQEVEHEEDLQSLREDLDLMVQRGIR